MSSTDSPAVARRRVRLALKAAREAKKFTQTQVANAMEWSLSKVMRIEKGEVNVAPSDLRVLMDYLDISDPDQVQSLLDDARMSRQERWTVDAADREFLTPAMIELYQFEAEATVVRIYSNHVVPGRLQSRQYAEALIQPFRAVLGDDTATARIEARLRYQEILYRPQAPAYLVLLDESVLMRPIGGNMVMADQLARIVRMMAESSLHVRIISLQVAANSLRFLGPFTLCDLGHERSAFLYRENEADEAVRAGAVIDDHRRAFEEMWLSVPDEAAARIRIESAIADLRRDGP